MSPDTPYIGPEDASRHYLGANYDEATMEQQRQIEREIAKNQPLIGDVEDFSFLEKEFKEDPVYQLKIQDLKTQFTSFRRTRRDGNCFFRAFGFSYLEHLLSHTDEMKRFKELAEKSKDILVDMGFPQFTIEDFHDTFMDVLERVEKQCSIEDLLEVFNEQGYSDYLVVYLRLLASGHLQKKHEFYMNFMEGGKTVKEFCSQEVEPMGKESDHIHIISLTSAANVPVCVMYMDRNDTSKVVAHNFPEDSQPKLYLLYRPGHYDILYK